MLKSKKIVLGITGGIAAYKSAVLARLLIKAGAEVRVVMTPAARDFITINTMAALTGNPVLCDFFNRETGRWNSHISIADWADVLLIAPASANTIAKMVNGIADNLLLTTYLSSTAPVVVAPAMDLNMYKHAATRRNLRTLTEDGVHIIEPASGILASGLIGKGRMEEPEKIVAVLEKIFNASSKKAVKKKLDKRKVLVTAGPTYEAIDAVRYIANYSSGKMGVALAYALADEGASVSFVCGPLQIPCEHPNIKRYDVVSAQQMYERCLKIFPSVDAAIMAAAVADYTPVKKMIGKTQRQDALQLQLVATPDIAAELGKRKKKQQVLAGFALEADEGLNRAKEKMKKKNLDFIVLNSLKDKNSAFGFDTNKITIIDKYNNIDKFELKNKQDVAADIVEKLIQVLCEK